MDSHYLGLGREGTLFGVGEGRGGEGETSDHPIPWYNALGLIVLGVGWSKAKDV